MNDAETRRWGDTEKALSPRHRVAPSPCRGSILIGVIWALALLAIFTVAVNRQVTAELIFGRWLMDHALTRGLAKAGIERALYELQADQFEAFDAVNETWGSYEKVFKQMKLGSGDFSVVCNAEQGYEEAVEGFRYGLCDEAARLNLNTAGVDTLKIFFAALLPDIEEKDRTAMVEALIDWRDADDARLPNGAEDEEYHSLPTPYEPRNGNMESVEELLMIRGFTPEIYKTMQPYVTVYTDGKVNFNTASEKVLQALGLSEALAGRMAAYRLGEDLTVGTKDDAVFQDPGSITASFSVAGSFSSEEYAQIANAISADLVTVRSDVFRIYGIGRLIRGSRTPDELITCVMRRDGKVLYWKEGRT